MQVIPEILEDKKVIKSDIIGDPHIKVAQRVIAQEVAGLKALSASLDGKFSDAVELLHGIRGRLIITGMGKSGHVARKIAATMASTGTPAFFVHPGEASHGDLGMVTRDDALVMLSNSGETAELQDMIVFAKRFSIPIVAMVRRKTSVLVEAATVALVLPDTAEAAPVGAPTTSTTMMMALGDALAVALLEMNGFTAENFGTFHPGGSLGKAFVRVKELMHGGEQLPIVRESTPMSEVLLTITSKSFGCAAVVDASGDLLGIITDGDLRRHIDSDLLSQTASQVMTANPRTIYANSLAAEALGVMNDKKITSLFVVDEAKHLVGILHIHDCLRAGIG